MLIRALAGVLLALLIVAPFAGAAPPDAHIRGLVFAAGTDAPVQGVRVAVPGGPSAKTDADGAFRLVLPAGEVVLVIGGAGFPKVRTPPVRAVAGHVTEVLATVRRDGEPPEVSVEAAGPVAAGPETAVPDDRPRHEVSGVVERLDGAGPVEGARVYVRGNPAEATTDARGRFLLRLPEGSWDLTIIHPQFTSRSLNGLQVPVSPEGAEESLRVALPPASVQLDEFVVSAPRIEGGTVALLEERRESRAVSDIIGAEQMSRSGDSDAAGALTRVTGVTLVDGKYVYVRGMGDRYSTTLLDGAHLPSPDPTRRVVPLDMFPTDMLESIVVQKSWSPDRPGEFGGGVVSLRTRAFPSEPTASVSLSAGVLTGTTFSEGLAGTDGPTDWLGFDGGHRALSDEVAEASREAPLLETDRFGNGGYTAEQLERFGESLDHDARIEQETLRPDLGLAATGGTSWEIGPGRGGFLAALTYDNEWTHRDGLVRYYNVGSDGGLEIRSNYDPYVRTTNHVGLNGILSMGWETEEDHALRATTVVNRSTDDIARRYEGYNRDVDGTIRISRLRWVERMLVSQQLHGEHTLAAGGPVLGWRYAWSLATGDEPNRRDWRYDYEEGVDAWFLSDRPEGNRRVFSEAEDRVHDAGLDVTIPVELPGAWDLEVKTGAAAAIKRRDVDTRRFTFQDKGPLARDDDVLRLPIHQVLTPEYIGPDGFQLAETTLGTDRYRGRHDVFAGFGMATVQVPGDVEVAGGVRLEHSIQRIETYDPFAVNPEAVEGGPTTTDVLPSVSARWSFREDMQLRAAVGRTLNRPNLRELSPAVFNSDTGGYMRRGNPDLQPGRLTHVDARWEWYPDRGESVSVGAFFKHLDRPIEDVIVQGAQFVATWQNADRARNLGVEVEARKGLGFLSPTLRDLYVAGNAAWIWSRVEIGADGSKSVQTNQERPLQGQSPFVFNLQVGWDDADRGSRVALLYNVFGRRIARVGTAGAPDTYEEPVHRLDLVLSQDLGAGVSLGFKAKNLVDPPVEQTQGGRLRSSFRKGRELSLGVSKRF
ncbi:MAG: TonB-dependent receptor domain-containing protein [Myxococcota bacterium]